MIAVTRNGADISSSVIFPTLQVEQTLTNEADTCSFSMRFTLDALQKEDGDFLLLENGERILIMGDTPAFNDLITVSDGGSVVFAGRIARVEQHVQAFREHVFNVSCVDHAFEMDRRLASKTYTNQTVAAIIADLVTNFAPGFTYANASGSYVVPKIVFNQVPLSTCLSRLADLVRYDWYVDENKDVHFFPASTNAAPFSLTDTAGNHVYKSLVRASDGSQLVNRVRVRGGEYDGSSFTDTITVSGNATKSFVLPYKMSNLAVSVDTGAGFVAQTVGVDFIDTFTDFQVLYNYQAQSFRFQNALAAGAKVQFTGNPKIPAVGIVQDSDSIAKYGIIEKFIRDESIKSSAIARQRAAAELLTYADEMIDARFSTYTAGLRTGMTITINPAGISDTLLIKRITFSGRTPQTFQYDVECISTQRYTLIDLLRKIIVPQPKPTDENEVSENLVASNEEVTFTDAASVYSPSQPLTINTQIVYGTNSSGGATSFSTTIDATGATTMIVAGWMQGANFSVTYNGVALTKDAGSTGRSSIWHLSSPSTGSNTLLFSTTDTTINVNVVVYLISGLNNASLVAASTSTGGSGLDQSAALSQPGGVATLGIFTTSFLMSDGSGASFTPDLAGEVESLDAQPAFTVGSRHTVLHQIFTRAGSKTMGTTLGGSTSGWTSPNTAMVLCSGFDPQT